MPSFNTYTIPVEIHLRRGFVLAAAIAHIAVALGMSSCWVGRQLVRLFMVCRVGGRRV